MILTRKLILPAVIVFAVLLAGIFANTFKSLHDTYHEAEEGDLVSYSNAFVAELENQKGVALALASAAAGNPSIQQAFAERDRQKLVALTLPSFEMLKEYKITEYQYHLPNGLRFLSLNDLNNQELGGFLSVVELANTEQRPVAGLESENGRLGIRAAAPIYYQGNHIGTVEFGIGFNDALLIGLKEKYGGEWSILLSQDLLAGASPQQGAGKKTPVSSLVLYATTQDNPLFNDEPSYVRALNGETAITHPSIDGRDYAILTSPLYDFSGRSVGTLDIVYDHTHISSAENKRLLFVGLVSVLALVLGGLSLVVFTSRTLQPIRTLTTAAAAITEGNITGFVGLKPSADEIGTLTTAFNHMTMQLRNSITDLENRVADRTRDLESQTNWLRLAAEIVRDAASARNLDELLIRSTTLILERFKFYHTAIFLHDNNKEYAVLVASPTEVGRQMIANNYKFLVGEGGIVGSVFVSGEPRITLNTDIDSAHFNPLLPNTRSEMALPLRVETNVIGVLDIHSDQPQAFNAEDIAIMQIMADQLATAIDRAHLLQAVETNLNELEVAYGQYTRKSWKRLVDESRTGSMGYRFDNIRIQPIAELPELGSEALITGKTISSNGSNLNSEKQRTVAIPIKLRGQTIGVVSVKLREGYDENTISTIESAAERLAAAMESARLYEEASLRADREQSISRVTTAISASTEYEEILKTTVTEIGNMLKDTEVAIQILEEPTSIKRREQ